MRRTLMLAAVVLAVAAGPARALAPCPGPAPEATVLLSGQGLLESVIVDDRGRLFFTSPQGLMRLDSHDGQPKLLTPVSGGGGLAFDADGMLVVGYGDTVQNGSTGDQTGPSGLLKVDPETGKSTVFATGLSMANGVARAPNGAFYASNDIGHNIDRIAGGKTERGWSQVESGNGLAVDLAGRYLYVAQTFRPAAIARVDLHDPSAVTTFAAPADPADTSAGLDGMTIDGAGRLFVAANGAGEIWRAGTDGALCLVAGGLPPFPDGPSAVAVGNRRGTFPAENLYAVTFGGQLVEYAGVVTPPARMRLRARFHLRRHCGRRGVTFRLADAGGHAVAGADVRFDGALRRTGRRGRTRFAGPLSRNGRLLAEATRAGYDRARLRVRVRGCA